MFRQIGEKTTQTIRKSCVNQKKTEGSRKTIRRDSGKEEREFECVNRV